MLGLHVLAENWEGGEEGGGFPVFLFFCWLG